MKSLGVMVGFGLLATVISGTASTMFLQPIVSANIAFGANTWLASWVVAGVAGYSIALIVWMLFIGVIMSLFLIGME